MRQVDSWDRPFSISTRRQAARSFFEGANIQELKTGELRTLRRKMQIVFQDPYSSLDPRMPVGRMPLRNR